jgi:hypothetical protein
MFSKEQLAELPQDNDLRPLGAKVPAIRRLPPDIATLPDSNN